MQEEGLAWRGLQLVALVWATERATERERRHLPEQGPLEGSGAVRFQVMEAGLVSLRVEANPAWAGMHPTSWISSLCADPQDSPRPKGWETTLEPYRTSSREVSGSQRPTLRFKPTVPIL